MFPNTLHCNSIEHFALFHKHSRRVESPHALNKCDQSMRLVT